MSEPVVTTRKIIEALQREYPRAKGWATAREVQDPVSGRRADFMAWNFWDGRTEIHEVKMTRNDARNDLNNPGKSEPLARQVSAFWVACPLGVVTRLEAHQRGWGLFEVHGEGMFVRVPGIRRGPAPSHELATAFLRRVQADDTLQALLAEAEAVGEARGKNKVLRERPAATYTWKDIKNAERRGESAERRRWKAKQRKQEGKPA